MSQVQTLSFREGQFDSDSLTEDWSEEVRFDSVKVPW